MGGWSIVSRSAWLAALTNMGMSGPLWLPAEPRLWLYGLRFEEWAKLYGLKCGGDTLGDDMAVGGAERIALGAGGGGIISGCKPCIKLGCCGWPLLPRLELGLLCILECRVSSSDRENFLLHPGNWQACGFSPVCVLMCLVWCSRRWKALSHMWHL